MPNANLTIINWLTSNCILIGYHRSSNITALISGCDLGVNPGIVIKKISYAVLIEIPAAVYVKGFGLLIISPTISIKFIT